MFLIAKLTYMKHKFYFLLLVPVLLLASCTKGILDNRNNITGTWEIVAVERQTNYGSEPIYTGYEEGTFYFNNNGSASYSDRRGQLTGSWSLIQRADGNSLELRLYDYYNDEGIEWEFYSVDLYSGRMVGYMDRFGEHYRFEFRRY